MAGTIETITDRSRFPEIFNTHIAQAEVNLRTSNGNLRIRFLGFTEGMVAFKIPYIKSMPDTALVFARIGEVTAYIELKSVDKQADNVFVFSPLKLQLIHTARREDRSTTDGGSHKSLVFITSIISDFLLYDSIRREKRKIEHIRDKVLDDLKKIFSEVKVLFIAEETGDPRMRFFNETNNNPIFIPNINEKAAPGEEARQAFYRENIYTKEQFNMKRKGLISEITMPVLYRGKIPYGYLQTNNTVPINSSSLQILSRASDLASNIIMRSGIFTDFCKERLLVSDVSKKGIGVVFRDRKFIRYFKEKSKVVFDLSLPDGTNLPISAIVRNITLLENKIIKIGCEICTLDDASRSTYEKYLNTHIPVRDETPPQPPPQSPKEEKPNDSGDILVV
jgi:hypothetical protein